MDPNPVSKQRAIFLVAMTIGVVAFIVVAVLVSKSPHVKSPGAGDSGSHAVSQLPAQVSTTRITGLHDGTYYGQTIKFAVPAGVENVSPTQGYSLGDEVTFTFGSDGSGSLMSQPGDAIGTQAEIEQNYPGKKKPIEIAGAQGFLLDQSAGDVASVTAIALKGPLLLTIQLTGTSDPGQLDKLATELGSAIQLRSPSQAGS